MQELIYPFNKTCMLMNDGFISRTFFTSNSIILILKYCRQQTKTLTSNLRKIKEQTN